jgi:hypothetical protein
MLAGLILSGCHTAEKAAVSTFKVVDAPANYIRHKIDSSEQTTTTTTTTTSDVANPGYFVTQPTPAPQTTTTRRTTTTATAPQHAPSTAPQKISPNPTPHAAAQTPTQFPTARPVPGKPGYVYSLDPNGGMIDVTGYKSGDKAKDPYTKQIFIVP